MKNTGLLLVFAGCAVTALGLVLVLAPRIPWLGRLPGDIHWRGRNFSVHFPLATSIVVSVVLTLLVNLAERLFRR